MNKNLWQHYYGVGPKAQIATLLTLIVAVIFLFLAVTLNIGKVSQKKTALSNAADASVLEYASLIGSFSHYLSVTYVKGKLESCQWSWRLFFKSAIWALIVAVVTGNLLGAFFGDTAAGIGGIGGGVVGGITKGPLYYMEADAWKAIGRQINKMSNQMKFREETFLSAMSRVVDDPNLIVDSHDYDEDGFTDDKVPPFLQFFYERFKTIEQKYTRPLKENIDVFKVDMMQFNQQALAFKSYLTRDFEPLLDRLEKCNYELTFWEPGVIEPESCQERCCPEEDPYCSSCQIFEDSCPATGNEEEDCPACSYDCCYEKYLSSLFVDQVEAVTSEIGDFSSFVCGDAATCSTDGSCGEGSYQGLYCQDTERLAENISDWLPLLYDSTLNDCDNPCTPQDERQLATSDDYFDVIGKWDSWINGWIYELETIDRRIQDCKANPESECGGDDRLCCCLFGKDEIAQAVDELERFRQDIRNFQAKITGFYDTVNNLNETYEREGKVYSWRDKAGDKEVYHYVRVELSKFRMPKIKSFVKGHEKCVRLVNPWGRVWVEISRYDEPQSGYPLWNFRYHKDEDSQWCASKGEKIFDEEKCQKYLIKAYSQASYSYTQNPPKIKAIK